MTSLVRNIIHYSAVLLFMGLVAACSSPLATLPPVQSASGTDYRVQPGDQLVIVVQDLDSASDTYVVDSAGQIAMPLLKGVQVQGLRMDEIEKKIETGYRDRGILMRPSVTVRPGELLPVYVIGEVHKPGEYAFRQGMTVFSALAAAGGYTYRAKTNEVEIRRTVDGKEVKARADESTLVEPGDRIRVYERWF